MPHKHLTVWADVCVTVCDVVSGPPSRCPREGPINTHQDCETHEATDLPLTYSVESLNSLTFLILSEKLSCVAFLSWRMILLDQPQFVSGIPEIDQNDKKHLTMLSPCLQDRLTSFSQRDMKVIEAHQVICKCYLMLSMCLFLSMVSAHQAPKYVLLNRIEYESNGLKKKWRSKCGGVKDGGKMGSLIT